MSLSVALILLISGLFVGFINTLSAGGTVISVALYLALGLPANVANATNRINVLIQSFGTSYLMHRNKLLDINKAIRFSVPAIIGALIGSLFAVRISNDLFSYFMGAILLFMIVFLFYKPKSFHEDNLEKINKKTPFYHYIVFFFIGIYGGFIQVGTGFYLIMAGTGLLGLNILRTNALKIAIMGAYTVVAMLVFVLDSKIIWSYGLVHSAGAIIGSWIATRFAMRRGAGFVNIIIILVIILTALNLFGIIDLQKFFASIV